MEIQNSLATFWTFVLFGLVIVIVIVIPSLQKVGIANLVEVGQKTAKSNSCFRGSRAGSGSGFFTCLFDLLLHNFPLGPFFLFYLLLCLFYFFFSNVFAFSSVASFCFVVFFLGNHFSLYDFYL